MTEKNMKPVFGLLTVMGCAWLCVIYLDWSRLWTREYTEALLSRQIKTSLAFAAFLLVLIQYKVKLSGKDHWLLSGVFFLLSGAEVAFFKDQPQIGMGIFAFSHIVMIIRHLGNIKAYIRSGELKKQFLTWLLVGAGILTIDVIILVTLFGSFTKNPLYPILAGYSVFLCMSVGAGIATNVLGYFPKKNAKIITAGIILFYLCDLTVGLNILFSESGKLFENVISSSITWLVYFPALTLLALSGINWKKQD